MQKDTPNTQNRVFLQHVKNTVSNNSQNVKPLENQGFSQVKQNPEDLSSGPQIWWTIRGSNTNRHLSTILGKEVIRIACRFVLKAVLKNALSPKNRMIYKGFRAPPTGFEPYIVPDSTYCNIYHPWILC